jgi:ketosteroid isomerase-like protein
MFFARPLRLRRLVRQECRHFSLHRLNGVSQDTVELLFRGYRAFVDGDLEAIGTMLDPDVEWVAAGEEAILVSRDRVLDVLAERVAEDYHVVVDRAIGLPDRVVVSMRFSRVERDPTDDRPLQSRRSYLLGRWAAVVHAQEGRVVRVEEYPHLEAALDAVGIDE